MQLISNLMVFVFMRFIFVILPLTLLLSGCEHQLSNTTKPSLKHLPSISQQQMLEDFDIFQSLYEEANSGLYKYHSKASVDKKFAAVRSRIHPKMDIVEFFKTISELVVWSGSCHSFVDFGDSTETLLKSTAGFFPLPLKVVDGALVVNIDIPQVPVGSRLVSINGVLADRVIAETMAFSSTDGYNTTGKTYEIQSDYFPLYFFLAFGYANEFQLDYIERESGELKTYVTPATTYVDAEQNYTSCYSLVPNQIANGNFSLTTDPSQKIAQLSINSFLVGIPGTPQENDYREFLDSSFLLLKDSLYEYLIVDVRDNDGGLDPNDLLLYSYLTEREFRENKSALVNFLKVPFPHYFVESYDGELGKLEEKLKEKFIRTRQNKFEQDSLLNPIWEPNQNRFKGEVYVLLNPGVASAGTVFASMIKSDGTATLIGEETLGGYYGHTGHTPVAYELPNSKFQLTFSLVDLIQDVEQNQEIAFGQGVIPDHEITLGIEAFMNQGDPQMEFALHLIQEKEKAK